jgi:hypothetical protein
MMILDEAESIVDRGIETGDIWRGALIPYEPTTTDPFRQDYAQTEWLAERAELALLSARVRFRHMTRVISRKRRDDGVWIEVAGSDDGRGEPEVPETIRVDVEAPVAELVEGLHTHQFGFPGMTVTREVTDVDGGSRVVELISQSVTGVVELRADPQPGPHGVIRFLIRVRNTTEPLQQIIDRNQRRDFALVGCHAIVALSKGRFISIEDPPAFSARYVALCENQGTRPHIVDDSARILLSAPIPTAASPA